jgi:ABC-2 type transport system ATP-binding protein
VQGTAAEVVAGQHLATWTIHGERLAEVSQRLHGKPGVDQTVVFGSSLHAIGHDATALERSVTEAAQLEGLRAERADTGIEDVFIYLMSKSAPPPGAVAS